MGFHYLSNVLATICLLYSPFEESFPHLCSRCIPHPRTHAYPSPKISKDMDLCGQQVGAILHLTWNGLIGGHSSHMGISFTTESNGLCHSLTCLWSSLYLQSVATPLQYTVFCWHQHGLVLKLIHFSADLVQIAYFPIGDTTWQFAYIYRPSINAWAQVCHWFLKKGKPKMIHTFNKGRVSKTGQTLTRHNPQSWAATWTRWQRYRREL